MRVGLVGLVDLVDLMLSVRESNAAPRACSGTSFGAVMVHFSTLHRVNFRSPSI